MEQLKFTADINSAGDGWIQVTLTGEGVNSLAEKDIEKALNGQAITKVSFEPLVWAKDEISRTGRWSASHPFGTFTIVHNTVYDEFWSPEMGYVRWNSLGEAQKAVQAKYDEMLNEGLYPKARPDDDEEIVQDVAKALAEEIYGGFDYHTCCVAQARAAIKVVREKSAAYAERNAAYLSDPHGVSANRAASEYADYIKKKKA